jgi:alpha-tubulin suppressor-like RCC1 family protein
MRKALVPCIALFAVLALTACDEQPVGPDDSTRVELDGPSFAKGGIKGPPAWIEIPRPIGPPPRVPVPLPPQAGPPAFLNNVVAVGTGYYFSCVLRSGGAVLCWGTNSKGELGDGTQTASAVPVRVAGGLEFARLFVGDDRACGITAEGNAYCWGSNFDGQLGAGQSVGPISAVPVPVAGGHHFSSLSMGLRSTCGMAEDGIAYCWGQNNVSQLGVDLPRRVSAYTPLPVINSASLGLVTVNNGFLITCGLDGDGAVFCWGLDRGNFGNGSGESVIYPTPTPAASGMTLATIEVGSEHACGLDHDGSAYCWGRRNILGEQGIGSTTPAWSPTAVLGGLTFASIDTDDTVSHPPIRHGAGATTGMVISADRAPKPALTVLTARLPRSR